MRRVLAFADYYLPAYKAGGPIASISRIVARLGGEAEFAVFTRDRDLGDAAPFSGLSRNEWTERSGGRVFYASPDRINLRGILGAIRQARPETIYLNSYFSPMTRSVLLLRRLGLLEGIDVTLGPRGEFGLGALGLKRRRKRAYLAAARLLGLHRDLLWQASSEHEAADIRREIAKAAIVVVAPDIVAAPSSSAPTGCPAKIVGSARFAFLSRIAPIKNLHRAIELLGRIQGEATFTVYGPQEDAAYWACCQAAIDALPSNIRVEVAGPVPPERVVEVLSREQFFLLPTLGENFGHVIAEALSAGLPTLVSDRTPWLDLEAHGAGWSIPLEDEKDWSERLQACVDMDAEAHAAASRSALRYIEVRRRVGEASDANRLLFGLAPTPTVR